MKVSPALRAGAALAAAALLLPAAASAQEPVPTPDPAVTMTAPTAGAALGAGVPATLAAQTSDGLSYLTFQVDGLPLCVLRVLRYCTWTPTAGDIGSHVIQATGTDPLGRTATATAAVRVDRLAPAAVTATVARHRVRARTWRLTTRGAVRPAPGLTASACAGTVTVTVLDGRHTLVDRSARVRPICTYRSTVTLLVPRRARRLTVRAVFSGAALLAPRAAPARSVSVR